jgi:hypothetical protein
MISNENAFPKNLQQVLALLFLLVKECTYVLEEVVESSDDFYPIKPDTGKRLPMRGPL